MELVIGSQRWSSWSLRPWLALRHLGIAFDTTVIALRRPDTRSRIARVSPSGKVPVLLVDGHAIWDSLAICEYANELAGGRGWPEDAAQRAHARSISLEMHGGFAALRATWPMEAGRTGVNVPLTTEAAADVERVQTLWTECRTRYGAAGPWLFGTWTIADAMYAPVVLRFHTYAAELRPLAQEYLATTLADRHLEDWLAAAAREPDGD